MDGNDDPGVDRRELLRKLAAAGTVGWVAPVILSSSPVAAGVFTAKCAPGPVSASASAVRTACAGFFNSTVSITLTFAGSCPCGGTPIWCARKTSPGAGIFSSTSTLSFNVSGVGSGFTTISGQVALGCTDRDGDTQFNVYNWSVQVRDFCPFSFGPLLTPVTLVGPTPVLSATCPI